MAKGVLKIRLVGDKDDLKNTLDGAVADMGTFAKGLKAAGAAVGVAAGTAVAAGFAKNLEFASAAGKLNAQLGVTGERAEELGGIAASLYSNAFGENIGQVNHALRSVIQSGAVMEDASSEQLESVTGKVLNLATAFDEDLGEAARAVGNMIKTGMATDAEQGLDIITRAFQQGNNIGGDLLETINEYGVQFQKLGLDGSTAMGLISQSLKAGARDSDFVVDALKEFALLVPASAKAAQDAFVALGLDARQMAADVAAGGPAAAAALDLTLDKLRAMEDPVARDTAAIALFGTKAEDLQGALLALDPSSAAQALGTVAGATDQTADALTTAQTRITEIQRTGELWAASLVTTQGPIGDLAATAMAFGGPAIAFAGNIGMVALAVRGLGATALLSAAKVAASWVIAMGPVGWVIALIAGLVLLVIANWDEISAWTSQKWGEITGWVSRNAETIKGVLMTLARVGLAIMTGGLSELVFLVIRRWDDIVGFVRSVPGRIWDALGNLGGLLRDAGIALISGFWDGLVARWNQLMAWARGAMANLRALWPFSPAKEGPFSGTGYVTYSGKALTEDFASSLRAGMPTVLASARELMSATRGQLSGGLGAHVDLAGLMAAAESSARAQLAVLTGAGAREAMPSAAAGAQSTVRVVFDFDGADGDLKRLFRHAVRTEGRGSAERFFQRAAT